MVPDHLTVFEPDHKDSLLKLSSVMLTFAILRGQMEPVLLQNLSPHPLSGALPSNGGPVSPLHAPHGDFSSIYGSCSIGTFEIVRDMHMITQTFLARWNHSGDMQSTPSVPMTTNDAQLQQIYSRLLQCPSIEDDLTADWIYESCRLAALIYCRSIIHSATFADSGNIMHARNSGHSHEPTTLLAALHDSLGRTDTRACWGNNLRGIFLWVCLIGGAASWSSARFVPGIEGEETSPASPWARKCFALYAVRAAVSVSFEHSDATVQALRTMLQVRYWMTTSIRPPSVSQ